MLKTTHLALLVGFIGCAAMLACGSRQPTPKFFELVPTSDMALGPGDSFEVTVYGEKELSGKYRVAEDGAITFPLVGRIEVAGQGPASVAKTLETALIDQKILRQPSVSVFLLEQTSRQVSVAGAVAKPGSLPLKVGMTVIQAIVDAGGLTPLASGNNTIVTRRVNGELKRFHVGVEDISEGRAENFELRAGDIVYVPERIF